MSGQLPDDCFGKDGKGHFGDLSFWEAIDPELGHDHPDFKIPLESCGEPVRFGPAKAEGDDLLVLKGFADGELVVKVVINKWTGEYNVWLFKAIDHPDEGETHADDPLTLIFKYTTTDKDGDSVENKLKITVKDDAPDAKVVNGGMLAEGGRHHLKGQLPDDCFGKDGKGHFGDLSFWEAIDPELEPWQPDFKVPLESCGEPVRFGPAKPEGDDLLVLKGFADGELVVKVVINKWTGEYNVWLFKAIDHPDESETGSDDPLTLIFKYTTTDKDGDSVENKLKNHSQR